jgi:hypothetical protein
MNHKFIPAVAAILIIGIMLSSTPLAAAQAVVSFGPKLDVVTIPQDNQKLKTGVMLLGMVGNTVASAGAGQTDVMSQHKIIVTYNGATLQWRIGDPGPSIACNVLEKDKVNVIPDPKSGDGQQFPTENLLTKLVDVSNKFVCKVRWKSPAAGILESTGVLDVYFTGLVGTNAAGQAVAIPPSAVWIADNILVVEAFFTVGRTVVFGSDIQDICVLGYAVTGNDPATSMAATWIITKPDGTQHYIWANAMGNFVGCESLALAQRDVLGLKLPTGQDPLFVAT